MGPSTGRQDSKHNRKSSTGSIKASSPDVWCIFRLGGGACSNDPPTKVYCDKATGVCEADLPPRCHRHRKCSVEDEDDSCEDLEEDYTTAGESFDMDESFNAAGSSFCSIRSTATMDQGELAEQLALVQEMVQEMKTGFAMVMEELGNIQFGDQTLQQQMVSDRSENKQTTTELTEAVQALKVEIQDLSGQLKNVSEAQMSLEVKVDSIQSFDKENFLEELQTMGVISDQARYQLQIGNRASDVQPKEVSPLVHPYLASLNQAKADDCDSVTALACKSLNLSQALQEKCLHLDLSASSDDNDETILHAQNAGLALIDTDSSHLPDAKALFSKKIPPHEKLLEEVQREKSAQEIVSAERSFCKQLWTLIDAVIRPLRQEELMSQRDLHSVFPSYLPHLYEQHCIMLRKMEERLLKWKYTGLLGDVFVKFTDAQEGEGLSAYKDYINDFPTMISNMKYWFTQSARFRDIMGSSSLANSRVIPLLLAPLQQIPKYSLLIKSMLKHTVADHPDRYYLETALSRLKTFLSMMNNDLDPIDSIARSRDYGNSTRSRSSGSSCDANQVSSARDSGIHSNGEDNLLRQPASPNTTRRYVLQVLRDRRERDTTENLQHEVRERPRSAIPVRPHALSYGSHPDLATHELSEFVPGGTRDLPSYAPYQSSTKMYSSMTKIQQPRDAPKSPEKPPRKIKIRRRPDNQKNSVNSNYLRPLTPHFPFNGTPRQDMFNESGVPARSHSASRRKSRTNRPASSIDFLAGDSDRRNKIMEQMSFSPLELGSSRENVADGRNRNELHMSLQRMMADRDRSDVLESNRFTGRSMDNRFQPLDASSVRSSERDSRDSYQPPDHRDVQFRPDMHQQEEDYGIFGDDDEEDSYQHSPRDLVTPQRSRLREHEVMGGDMDYAQHGGPKRLSGEQLAASLAHSLGDSNPISTEEEESTSSNDRQESVLPSRPVINRKQTETFVQFSGTDIVNQIDSHVAIPRPEPRKTSRGGNSLDLTPFRTNFEQGEVVGDSVIHVINDLDDNPRLAHPSGEQVEPLSERDTINISTLERSRKYMVPAEKPSEDEIRKQQIPTKQRTSFSDINRNELKVSSVDGNLSVKKTAIPIPHQHLRSNTSPGGGSADMVTHIPPPRIRRGSASVERVPKKQLPVAIGRLSQPNLEQLTAGTKFPSPPVSPAKMTAKDTKIPLYSPNKGKKDRAPPSPRDPMLAKSIEDMSKLKKKTAFKQSIKNFFGRKRSASDFEDPTNVELRQTKEEGQV